MSSTPKTGVIVLIAVLINATGFAGAYYYFSKQDSGVSNIKNENGLGRQPYGGADVSSQADTSVQIKKMGETDPDMEIVPPTDCINEGCFNTYFISCKSAEYTGRADVGTSAGMASLYYRIYGYTSGGCRVYAKYVTNADKNLIGKEMFCTLNNGRNFKEVFNEQYIKVLMGKSNCSGTLVNVLKP